MSEPIPVNRPKQHAYDKNLPHNLEAERNILGAILLDNSYAERAFAVSPPDDFFLPQHRHIARAMAAMSAAGAPIDTTLLMEALTKHEQLDAAGGVPYLSQLADGLPRVTNVEHYAKIVAEKATLRRIVYEADDIQRKAMDPVSAAEDLLARFTAATSKIEAGRRVDSNGRGDCNLVEFLGREIPAPEHLIENLIPRGGSVMIVAMPHHLKSWFTLGLAIGSTVPGTILGKLEVKKPVRTLLMAVEDNPSDVQYRIKQLIHTRTFGDYDPDLVRIWPRQAGGFDMMNEADFQSLRQTVEKHKADHVIVDVMRRIFRGDINSPKESAALCEQFDRLRDLTGTALTIVHHENRKGEDIMRAGAGSFNFPGWADVMIHFKRKGTKGGASFVDIEADNQHGRFEPVRMTLDFSSEIALSMIDLEDSESIGDIRKRLADEWTWRDLAEAGDCHRATAYRRIDKWLAAGIVEKVKSGKRGRIGGLARYRFVEDSSNEE